jgi:HK97 family phage major capsid protein
VAVTAATATSDFSGFLPAHIAAPIFERAAKQSVVQRLAQQIPLGANGESVPYVSGRMSAGWVSEAATKPASSGAIGLKTMTPKKIAAIAIVSAEVVRANPGGYMDLLRPQIAEAFAVAFDYAALHNKGPDGTGSGPFSTYIDQTSLEVEFGTTTTANGGVQKDLVTGLTSLVNTNKRLTGFALDSRAEPILWGAVDTTGRPIYTNLPTNDESDALGSPGRLLGRPSFMGEGVFLSTNNAIAYGGDWQQAAWGVVGGISFDVSTEASVTVNGSLVSLWEKNLLAVRAEAEYGFLVNDTASFVRYVNVTS